MRQVRRQRQGYRGTETDGWRGLVVEGGGRTVRTGGTRARGVNSEEQRRGHGNAQSEVENRFRREEMGAMQEEERRVETPGVAGGGGGGGVSGDARMSCRRTNTVLWSVCW